MEPGQRPEQGPCPDPGSGQQPGQGPCPGSGQQSGERASPGSGQQPGQGPCPGPGSEQQPGQGPGPGSGQQPGERAVEERVSEPDRLSRNLFICSFGCGATFSKNWRLLAHLCGHTGQKPFSCEYEGCGKSFTRKGHLTRHLLTHESEKTFRCTDERCNKTFTTKDNLKKHISRKHDNIEKLYLCDFEGCGRSFKKHQQLKVHQYEHTNVPPFKCNYEGCDKRFCLPSKLKRHEKIHAGYLCKVEFCSFIGKTWTELLSHTRKHHRDFVCNQCNKKFKRKAFLQAHLKTHAQVREVFRCPRKDCERTYTTSFNLHGHILSFHERQRNFVCGYPGCGKDFSMKQSLERHSVVHDPKKQKLKGKRPRPKRGLASRLTGYIPSKNQSAAVSCTLTEMLEKTKMSGLEEKDKLTQPVGAN
ncbi:general transcription factor IIIA, b [Hemiscyllium ocellatum]|uniref:general transcription factor IIIA, b n=1 Tax=Hemiscyllium ocellatum TaxID=170820 RepID=UPI0029662DEC|nr:general transcription factor IIIA, b [Hemiscyllium ocellatum]